MGNIILSAFSDEYTTPFEEQLKGMKELGINYIEIRGVDGKNVSKLTQYDVKEAKAKLDAYGIGVSSIGSPFGKLKLDGDMDEHLESLRRMLDMANVMGAKYLRMFSFYPPEGKDITEYRSEVLDAIGRALVIAREYGVTLCHENEALIYGAVPERCLDLAEYFGGELKVVFDMGNFVLENVEPMDAYKLLQNHIEYFHIKDALYAGAIVPAGCGEAKIGEILNIHKKYARDDFFISLEPHLQLFSGLNSLAGRSFDNPYKYENTQTAFIDAVNKLRNII